MFEWTNWWGTVAAVALALIANVVLALITWIVNATAGKRTPWLRDIIVSVSPRAHLLILVIGVWTAAGFTAPAEYTWWPALSRVFLIVAVLVGAWFVSGLASFGFGRMIARYSVEQDSVPEIRRMRTQLKLVRRLVNALIAVLALGVVLFSFPEVRAVGTSVLASAGILSLVAGLAAQSTLGNLVAGIQLVFSDAIRVDDVVVVEGEFGTIGEITLSYVVVYIWDERRLILPCTYFTTKPFETWTRNSAEIMGTVFLDVDWRVPMTELRSTFLEFVSASELWDQRKAGMIVTDATGGYVTVRCTVSARDSDDVWTLRCQVREELVAWIQKNHPEALPVTRVQVPAAITSK